jgi:hypothetical protein
MATNGEPSSSNSPDTEWWCNFCNFKSSSQQEYLKHSCKDVLEAQGKNTAPTDQKECR